MQNWILLLLLAMLLCPAIRAEDTLTYEVSERPELISLEGSLWLDTLGLSAEELHASAGVRFSASGESLDGDFPLFVWARLALVNRTANTLRAYLCFDPFVDSVWVYSLQQGRIVPEGFSGNAVRPADKEILEAGNFVPLVLEQGSRKLFYFRMRIGQAETLHLLSRVEVLPAAFVLHRHVRAFAWQSFYSGTMVLFCLVSVFMYFLFREQVFLSYAGLMFFFAAYFPAIKGVIHALFGLDLLYDYLFILELIISGMVVFGFLFLAGILRLPTQMPRFFRVFLVVTVFAASVALLATLLGKSGLWIGQFYNFILMAWLFCAFLPVVLLAFRGDPSARIVLFSFAILFLGALLYMLDKMALISIGFVSAEIYQIGTLLFSGILFYGLFDRVNTIRTEKQRVEELDQLKSRFFTQISHEFRTPLTLVMAPIRQLIDKSADPKDLRLLRTAHQNARRLLQLINQLLDLSRLEAGKMEMKVAEYEFTSLLKGIVLSFESLVATKHIRLHFVSQSENLPLYLDRDKVEKIFHNLLFNAYKFTPEQGEISVMVTESPSRVSVRVRDTGVGIPEARLPFIFDRFSQVENDAPKEHEGSGIGLALVRELVNLHKAEIRVESLEGKGSTFTLTFLKGKAHFEEEDLLSKVPQAEAPAPVWEGEVLGEGESGEEAESQGVGELPWVLLIEDHVELRQYIKEQLLPEYRVMEAINGEEGVEMALQHLPDLVISDVMMPRKDGYQVCQELKTDLRSSHIPIILLTAKAAQEEKLAGLETGADAYLTKPFDPRELLLRVRSLIELRQQLRERFSSADFIEPNSLRTNATDRAFLEKVCATIDAHLQDEQFSVEVLAEAVGMSRVHLNRKLNALTDQPASKFVLSFRLQRALELLRQRSGNVSEVAFATGFQSTSYFVKCFREKYGKTPGAFLEG